jgi:hypothetical protein
MKRAVVALLVSMSMLGCFPHNAKHRTYAKLAEGGALAAGIAISAFANTGADCDEMAMAGVETDCRTQAKWLSTAGVVLILGGLLGFVATISTAEEEDKTKPVMQVEKTDAKKDLKLPAGVTPPAEPQAPPPAEGEGSGAGSGSAEPSGSAATTSAAPQQ